MYEYGVVSKIISDTFALGLDIRIAKEIHVSSNIDNYDIGYFQYATNFEKSWK